jgi:hypothetical protein
MRLDHPRRSRCTPARGLVPALHIRRNHAAAVASVHTHHHPPTLQVAHAAVFALAVYQVTATFATGAQVAHGGRRAMHAILAEHGAYRIPKEKFVWYGDNPDAESTGADAPGLKADPNVPLHVKVSLPCPLFSRGATFPHKLASWTTSSGMRGRVSRAAGPTGSQIHENTPAQPRSRSTIQNDVWVPRRRQLVPERHRARRGWGSSNAFL